MHRARLGQRRELIENGVVRLGELGSRWRGHEKSKSAARSDEVRRAHEVFEMPGFVPKRQAPAHAACRLPRSGAAPGRKRT